ncbi:MAG: NAD(P)H-dependent glycerol-3-phosphate dehydrogenase, partial [Paracoccaceae bacterium]
MKISVLGSGAFGTALAISLSTGDNSLTLWGRNPKQVIAFSQDRENKDRLPNCPFPTSLCVTSDLEFACDADAILIAVPTQSLRKFVEENHKYLHGKTLIACCKGFDMETGKGPVDMLQNASDQVAILTGPSFANDIARGLPTALTLACEQAELGIALQDQLMSENIRLYRTQDVIGAELGGGLKNVIAIGCGAAVGAGLGESARAALMTRGFAEMRRFAAALGGRDTTLCGLSGLGDLSLT